MADQPGAELVLQTEGDSRVMSPSREYQIGRDPLGDVVLTDPRVSWHHAVLHVDRGHWALDDVGSTNGTYDGQGHRVRHLEVGPGSMLRFGNPQDGPRASLLAVARPATPKKAARPSALTAITGSYRQPTTVRPLPERTVRIGRALDNDLVVEDLSVSRSHAELRTRPDGRHEIEDLGSHNGTFLNGQPVLTAIVEPGDLIGIGHSVFCLVGDEIQEYVDTGEVALQVEGLSVQVGPEPRVLLDAVSFPVAEKSLLAVVGPSGAGKSTLLNALTGMRPADRGSVRYDGRDLYQDYAELRQRIGLVPQDDILHTQLGVRRALSYAAELRFPGDTEKGERADRVEEVITELGLTQRADQVISSLSGGQRKRVSVALELLTKPSLLFLDEPTSGLDPGMDRSVMHLLRRLADDGRTVIVVTHSVLNLEVCDRLLVLAPGGRIAYFGPPADALTFFGFEQWPEAFEAFENDQDRDWAGRYQTSGTYRKYVAGTMEHQPAQAAVEIRYAEPPKAQSWFGQLSTLVRRYVAALAADRTFLAVMIILPFVMGAMARALAGSKLTSDTALNALLILCVGGLLVGAANAVRELVKERAVYRRERAVGLSRSAYLWSKIVVLGAITVVQAVVMTVIGLAGVRIRPAGGGVLMPPLIEIALAVALLSFTAMMLGLLISALVKKEEVTMPLLVLLAIIQVVFCGALLQLHNVPGLNQLSWLVPSRWALAAMASTIDLHQVVPGTLTADPLFAHKTSTWLLDMGAMLLMSLILGLAVARLLRRHEPAIMRR
ncbi:FHA modulated ABC efflux pump with fused ATPase and integral membrane subunits [Catenulispora acidiphila DSM 44928]|uniref:FHA modulated ABC efflux pump with fused ATPase and integral membrane subunits n=1 Tax=Catenulispora acidiphila (strain DSM 44928 / JCM 14897 / NBRC 102108 / NRRL B-24433 / ID139908) TaxID=479433 RepID=C7Q6Y6_CATAD|nr:ATP-binding cassette domain-containing protein [Catenulispora acidiphila]ACU75999.1 FHA modulated ABC efflux pump with fused ATPase and integral membrane subunits [Catenulispora acidiphila DSM 44928]